MRFADFLKESMNRTFEYELVNVTSTHRVYRFADITGQQIMLSIYNDRMLGLDGTDQKSSFGSTVNFERNNRYDMSNDSTPQNTMMIFATVLKIVSEFVNSEKPVWVCFTADKSESSRISLYDRLVRKFAGEYVEFTDELVKCRRALRALDDAKKYVDREAWDELRNSPAANRARRMVIVAAVGDSSTKGYFLVARNETGYSQIITPIQQVITSISNFLKDVP